VASPWATNENQDGYDLRFRSSEYSGSYYRPKLVVTYKRQFNYVYYLKDHLGNIRVTVDKDGEVLGYDDYYPFGLQMPGRSSNTANPNHLYKYSAKELDEEIGLECLPLWGYYFGARYYDPVIARWLAVDPMADKYPSISPFVYCANSPLIFIDPTGETWVYVQTSDTTGYYQWVDDGKNDIVYTNSDIVNNNTSNGVTDWDAVGGAEGSIRVTEDTKGFEQDMALIEAIMDAAGIALYNGMPLYLDDGSSRYGQFALLGTTPFAQGARGNSVMASGGYFLTLDISMTVASVIGIAGVTTVSTTAWGGRVIAIGKLKYVGYRESKHALKHGYRRSIKWAKTHLIDW